MSIITFFTGTGKKWFPSLWSGSGSGVFDAMDADNSDENLFPFVSEATALKLSAVLACVQLRGETIGAMPLYLKDRKTNKTVTDHAVSELLLDLPNAYMTSSDFDSMSVARVDLIGNQISIIERHSRTREPRAINPLVNEIGYEFGMDSRNRPVYRINGLEYSPDDILHMRGFSMDGIQGLSRLSVGRNILSAQYQGDIASMRAFKQGLKVGGFFETPAGSTYLDDKQFNQFMARMARFSDPKNQSQWMPLPPGLKPASADSLKISPADAELLDSRYFGIEEICRLFNTPPMLIGSTSKASSWASSAEQLNLQFLTYSILPTLIRREKAFWHKLLTPQERQRYMPKYDVSFLRRVDIKSLQAFYASGLQNGYLNQNEVREMEDRATIGPDGEIYRVQLNMANADNTGGDNTQPSK